MFAVLEGSWKGAFGIVRVGAHACMVYPVITLAYMFRYKTKIFSFPQ
jgi:hypothetical protein